MAALITPGVATVTAGTLATSNVLLLSLLILPLVSVWVAVIVCISKLKVDAQDQLPSAATVAVQIVVAPLRTVTVASGSPVPLIAGFGATVLPLLGEVSTGANTMVSLVVSWLSMPEPVTLVCDARTVMSPSGTALVSMVAVYVPLLEHAVVVVNGPMVNVTKPWPIEQVPATA